MKRNILLKAACIMGILTFLTGCGTSSSTESLHSGSETNTPSGSSSKNHIDTAAAKSVALENAGLSEEDVSFVRLSLDSGSDSPKYSIEFISAEMQYDYVIDAVTGQILSMNCESGAYGNVPAPETAVQAGNTQPDTQQSVNQDNSQAEDTTTQKQPADASGPSDSRSKDQQQGEAGQYIGREAAQQAALSHAGLDADSVRFMHARLEYDDGRWKYDVEFCRENEEYDYDIDALTGEILSFDYDTEHIGSETGTASGEFISEEKAMELALNHAGAAESETQHMKIKLDYDDGRAEYEVEWYIGRTEYSCDVDACTGEIISFEMELD